MPTLKKICTVTTAFLIWVVSCVSLEWLHAYDVQSKSFCKSCNLLELKEHSIIHSKNTKITEFDLRLISSSEYWSVPMALTINIIVLVLCGLFTLQEENVGYEHIKVCSPLIWTYGSLVLNCLSTSKELWTIRVLLCIEREKGYVYCVHYHFK